MHASSQIEPLAIVGLSFKFPEDATSADGLWKILEEKRCVSRKFPESRINIDGFYDEDLSGVDKVSCPLWTIFSYTNLLLKSFRLGKLIF